MGYRTVDNGRKFVHEEISYTGHQIQLLVSKAFALLALGAFYIATFPIRLIEKGVGLLTGDTKAAFSDAALAFVDLAVNALF